MCCYGDLSKVASTNRKEGLISSHPENYLGNSLKRATTNRAPVSPQDNDKLPQVSTEDNADLGRALTLEEHRALQGGMMVYLLNLTSPFGPTWVNT